MNGCLRSEDLTDELHAIFFRNYKNVFLIWVEAIQNHRNNLAASETSD